MKQLFLLGFAIVCGATTTSAQQFPIRATAMMNPFQDHPAAAGVLGCMDLHMGYRNQWSGIEGAPQTAFANLHGQMPGQGDDFHGFGVRVESDEAGAWGYNAVNLAYAYNLRLTNGARLGSRAECRILSASTGHEHAGYARITGCERSRSIWQPTVYCADG